MKNLVFLTLTLAVTWPATAQKATRESVSSTRGITITKVITEVDTTFVMIGQNSQYTHITDIIAIKSGSARDLDELLTECMKFLSEKSGTSLQFKGNTLMSPGKNKLYLYGAGQDDRGFVLLNQSVISKLQTDLRAHL